MHDIILLIINVVLLLLKGSRITLPNNEIKNIIKLIRPLENRGIFLKETT